LKKSEKMTNNLAKYGKRQKIIQVHKSQANLIENESNMKTKIKISARKCN